MGKGALIFLIVVIIGLAIASYFVFFQSQKCSDVSCWESKLRDCRKANYINEGADVTWRYTIKGEKDNSCVVNVEVVQIIRGLAKTRILEGKNMDCYMQLDNDGKTIIMAPEANHSLCHGLLKEEMQTLIIERLHQHILENIGEISEGLTAISGVEVISETNITNSSI